MQSKGKRAGKRKRTRPVSPESVRKYTDAERKDAEARHGPVERERFQEVIRRLVTRPPPKKTP